MKVLTFYIAKEVVKGSLIAILILLTLYNLFSFSDELKDLGRGNYGMREIVQYLALTSPGVFYELLPSAALLGSLTVLGTMANNREIVAMRAAGLSTAGIIGNIMLGGLFLILLAVGVGEFVAPSCERAAQLLKSTAKHDEVVLHSQYGMWLREGNSFINVRKILDDGKLADVRIYDFNAQHKLDKISQADLALFQGDKQWRLQNVKLSSFGERQVSAVALPEQAWRSNIDSDLLKVAVVIPDNLSLIDLFMYIDFLQQNNQKSQRYELAFWSRLINPLVTFVMLMISAPFVLNIGRGVSTGARIMIGIVIGMTFIIFDKIAGHVGLIYDFNPVLVAVLPSALVFCFALYAVRKTN